MARDEISDLKIGPVARELGTSGAGGVIENPGNHLGYGGAPTIMYNHYFTGSVAIQEGCNLVVGAGGSQITTADGPLVLTSGIGIIVYNMPAMPLYVYPHEFYGGVVYVDHGNITLGNSGVNGLETTFGSLVISSADDVIGYGMVSTSGCNHEFAGSVWMTDLRYVDGNQGLNKILVSSVSGKASWADPTTVPGFSGTSGTSGKSGTSGASGTLGASGASGSSGTLGASGTSGSSGTLGASGTSGSSGTLGASGTSGSSGTLGVSGTSGTSGASGWSGISSETATFVLDAPTASDVFPIMQVYDSAITIEQVQGTVLGLSLIHI